MRSIPLSKRLFDLVGAAGGLLAFSPLMAVIAAAIVVEDGRPVLFRQQRVGRNRRPFTILKFRSMRDGRVTRVGRMLRVTGLDELPQFINILRGDMSAVGPRPLTASDVARLGWMAPRHDFRWRVRPGLTGLAQVTAARSGRLSLGLDRRYVARQRLSLDVCLVAVSFAINALGKKRVRRLLARRDPPAGDRIDGVYAQALHAGGHFEEAFDMYRDALAKSISVFGEGSRSVGESLSSLVPLEIEVGALKPAIEHARRAIDIYLKEGKAGSATHGGRLRKLGSALLAARSAGEAAERLDEAVRVSVAAKSELESLHARGSLGLALTYLGRVDEADRQLRLTIDKSVKSPRAHFLAMRNLGTLLRLQGRYAESLAWLEKAIAESGVQPGHRGDHAHVLIEAGQVRLALGEIDTAGELFGRAEKLFDDVQKQRMTPARADIMVGMARVQLQRREYVAALESARSASLFWREFDPDNRSAGEAALWLGRCYQALGRNAEAAEAVSRAQHLLARSPVPADLKLLQLARTPHASNDE
jgi:lipopolysaccharide/colanic/teichoic acid biosynthesis glycosyltransferase/tetratricopeptide (TPR) repeat protein